MKKSNLSFKRFLFLFIIAFLFFGLLQGKTDDKKLQDVFGAIEKGDLAKVQELLDKKVNISAKNEQGATPQHLAAVMGHQDKGELSLPLCVRIN